MNYYNNIKNLLIDNEIKKKVKDYVQNKNDLSTYYNVGKELSKAGKHYGEGIIKKYSERLTKELGKKYGYSTLKYMRQFFCYVQNRQPLVGNLSWSHYLLLLPLKDENKINYYINLCISRNLSKRQLRERMKSNEYERLEKKQEIN